MERRSRPSVHDEDPDSIVRDMVREDRAGNGDRDGTVASADAVEQLRRAVRDLKHDVRMLKVGVDKQTSLLEELSRRIEELRRGGERSA